MSENDGQDVLIFSDSDTESDLEEGEIEWGGTENPFVIPLNEHVFDVLFGLRQSPVSIEGPSKKMLKNEDGERVSIKKTDSNYVRLQSGEELFFSDEDGIDIMLNESIEPNRLIRNIISKVPLSIEDSLEYLAKFDYKDNYKEENYDSMTDEQKSLRTTFLKNLKEQVYSAYIKESRLRFAFQRTLVLWRTYKMNKATVREEDPITLTLPEKEVYVYDWSVKKRFILDAKSLSNLIESKLLYQEYGFPLPIYPKNPKNNVEFRFEQLVSIYNQLRDHGELLWGLVALKKFNFNKQRWQMYHKSALTMAAIRTNLSLLDTFEARELLLDFIFAKMDELHMPASVFIVNAYKVAVLRVPTHWYLEKLKRVTAIHFEAEHFDHNKTISINRSIIKIFKLQSIFIQDLKNKKLI
jgi:hypothetical protein